MRDEDQNQGAGAAAPGSPDTSAAAAAAPLDDVVKAAHDLGQAELLAEWSAEDLKCVEETTEQTLAAARQVAAQHAQGLVDARAHFEQVVRQFVAGRADAASN